ncbi:MAG: ABC transporter permease [Acetobacteraceae bacterium]|nr:ABC transporter permease [Acetobacteraceae bacterium]
MLNYTIRRVLMLVPVLLGVSLGVFLVGALQADPTRIMLGQHATAEAVAALREELGLNDPILVQYGRYVLRLAQGDLGRSWLTHSPVSVEIKARFPHTVELTLAAMALAVVVGIVAGIISAVRQYSVADYTTMVGALLGVSMPIFWLGLMLISVFAVELRVLPVSGRLAAGVETGLRSEFYILEALFTGKWAVLWDLIKHLIMPAVALAAYSTALIARMTRSSMLEVVRQDYVRTARAKGLSERVVIYKHALKNALIPVVTVIGLQTGYLLGGAVLTETVFSWPGVGSLAVAAIQNSDYPLVQGCVLLVAAVFVFINLAVDLVYAWIDPRIHYA